MVITFDPAYTNECLRHMGIEVSPISTINKRVFLNTILRGLVTDFSPILFFFYESSPI